MAVCLQLHHSHFFLPVSFKFQNLKSHKLARNIITASSSITSKEAQLAKNDLLDLISNEERGIKTQGNLSKQSKIIKAIEAMEILGKNSITTDSSSLSATWRMLWTTEKEQLFIIKNAYLFGTQTGDVLQVIDVEKGVLNNVITFPPSGVFFVRSSIEIASPQRVNFRFTSAVLRGEKWEFPLPPFGQGWFESVYLDNEIRVVKDIRNDYLVVDRAPYNWLE
ncbi:Plastid-lipid associated protein PAP / fibrillin family protein [Thalictrum thalictroides]|uniref:Plastid-lipid associated protein PAP / fibrillin family protein n=1 Tax=Thalictrum thalictroides TaxID=46969 RepID=A0A7J6WGY3_THATH|nr:Plastid-lipid associated protein PAP / fibrillin family protein [Thalictrum thalictroides]